MTLKSPQPPLAERAGAIARALVPDLAVGVGLALLVYGIDQIHRPTAFIVGGLIVLAIGGLAARRG